MENLFPKFNDYLKERNALDPTNAQFIYDSIIDSPLKNDPEYQELWGKVIERAIKYVAIRADWFSWDRAKRIEEDTLRTSRHNGFIAYVDILSNYEKQKGEESDWRAILGNDRKRIGDFACYIVLVRSLSAR